MLALSAGVVLSRYWGTQQAEQGAASIEVIDSPVIALDGTMHTLREWSGTVLMVNFWATWCAPCLAEMPVLQRAREKYRSQGLEFIGIAIDEADPVAEFRDRLGIKYPLLIAVDDPIDMLTRFGSETGALPHSVVLGKSGQILATHIGPLTETELEDFIRPHL